MCKLSMMTANKIDALENTPYLIGISQEYGLAGFHARGSTLEECAVCFKDGMTIMLRNVPIRLQKKYGIGETVTGLFLDNGEHKQDAIFFAEVGKTVNLYELAELNIAAFAGVPLASAQYGEQKKELLAA